MAELGDTPVTAGTFTMVTGCVPELAPFPAGSDVPCTNSKTRSGTRPVTGMLQRVHSMHASMCVLGIIRDRVLRRDVSRHPSGSTGILDGGPEVADSASADWCPLVDNLHLATGRM